MKMKLNLIFAPSADMLVPLAEESIRQVWEDPFDPPTVIVPNPAVGKWLKIRLAESPSFGCVANARMVMLESFLWNALGGGDHAGMITAERLAQAACAILDDGILNDGVYTPLKNYLYLPDGRIDALKRVQLSARIAAQFLEYEYNRPSVWNEDGNNWRSRGIDAKWIMGKPYYGGDGHEAWQMDLYRRIHECFLKSGHISLPHLYRRRREERAKENGAWCDVGVNRRIILFGVSKISHFHRNTLVEISQIGGVDMHVFLTNPCAEFWEDVDTSRRTIRRKWQHDSPGDLAGIKPVKPEYYDKSELSEIGMFADERDHTLLKLWGDAGRENIFLWCPQANWNFEYVGGVDPDNIYGDDDRQTLPRPKNTLLKSIQKSLLLRKNDLDIADGKSCADGSIQILACPDASREIEELREMILDMAHEERLENFNDVAVYMPDTNKYLPYIQRVFGALPQNHPEYIPFTVLGASCGSSFTSRALSALLNIISGQFNRARIFELLRNPIVWSSREISPDDVETWEEWAEKFGMFRGYDRDQRKSMGDMGEAITDEHTFKRGMEKVIAGIRAAEGVDGSSNDSENAAFETLMSIGAEPPEIMVSAETFLSLLRELNELSLSFINVDGDGTIDIRGSVKTLQKAVWSWLGDIPNDDSVNCALESRVRDEALGKLESILLQCETARRERMSVCEFFALAHASVPEETAVPANAWNGVTFAPLRASMILPHRAIFALGLGASDFPGVSESGSWNLLADKRNVNGKTKSNRIVGDSDKVRDNRFAFLEMIHAAKERLTLSYRARDMQKDAVLQPSSVIMELEEYLIGQGLTDGKDGSRRCSIRREIPWVVYESLDKAVERGRKHGTWDKTQRELALASVNGRVRHRHELSTPPANAPDSGIDAGQYGADINDLKTFLRNPLEHHLYVTLKMRDEYDTGDMSAIDEPMGSGYKLNRLRKKVWIAALNAIFPPEADNDIDNDELTRVIVGEAEKIYDEHIDDGQAPEGHVCRMERKALLEWAKNCAAAATELRAYFTNHRLAERYEFAFDCGPFAVKGNHQYAVLPRESENQSHTIGVVEFAKGVDISDNCDLWVSGAAQRLYEIKNGGARGVRSVLLSYGDEPKTRISRVGRGMPEATVHTNDGDHDNDAAAKVSPEDIEKWLTEVLTQMRIEKRREYLPFKAVAALRDGLTFDALKEYLSKNPYKSYKEAFKLADAKPAFMSDDELRELVRSRYALMLEGGDV